MTSDKQFQCAVIEVEPGKFELAYPGDVKDTYDKGQTLKYEGMEYFSVLGNAESLDAFREEVGKALEGLEAKADEELLISHAHTLLSSNSAYEVRDITIASSTGSDKLRRINKKAPTSQRIRTFRSHVQMATAESYESPSGLPDQPTGENQLSYLDGTKKRPYKK